MANDVMRQITDAEQAAEKKLSTTNAEAKRLVAAAEREGHETVDAAMNQVEAQVHEMLEKASDISASTAMEITATAERECEKLRILAKGRMKKAAIFIAEKVVKE